MVPENRVPVTLPVPLYPVLPLIPICHPPSSPEPAAVHTPDWQQDLLEMPGPPGQDSPEHHLINPEKCEPLQEGGFGSKGPA